MEGKNKMINWKLFCISGMIWSVLFLLMCYHFGNMLGAKLQLVCFLAYSLGLVRQYAKADKKNKDEQGK
jgi:hypothetical protein